MSDEQYALSTSPAPPPPTEADYEAIFAAVMETVRGRWFLAEFGRRNRHADTQLILSAIDRLESSMRQQADDPAVERVRTDIREMARAITLAKREIAAIKPGPEHAGRIGEATEELDSVVQTTAKATSDILAAAEIIQEAAWTLRERGIDGLICERLDRCATDIYLACSFQDLTGQRTRKVIQVLRYLEGRIAGLLEVLGEDAEPEAAEPPAHAPLATDLDQAEIDEVIPTRHAEPAGPAPVAEPAAISAVGAIAAADSGIDAAAPAIVNDVSTMSSPAPDATAPAPSPAAEAAGETAAIPEATGREPPADADGADLADDLADGVAIFTAEMTATAPVEADADPEPEPDIEATARARKVAPDTQTLLADLLAIIRPDATSGPDDDETPEPVELTAGSGDDEPAIPTAGEALDAGAPAEANVGDTVDGDTGGDMAPTIGDAPVMPADALDIAAAADVEAAPIAADSEPVAAVAAPPEPPPPLIRFLQPIEPGALSSEFVIVPLSLDRLEATAAATPDVVPTATPAPVAAPTTTATLVVIDDILVPQPVGEAAPVHMPEAALLDIDDDVLLPEPAPSSPQALAAMAFADNFLAVDETTGEAPEAAADDAPAAQAPADALADTPGAEPSGRFEEPDAPAMPAWFTAPDQPPAIPADAPPSATATLAAMAALPEPLAAPASGSLLGRPPSLGHADPLGEIAQLSVEERIALFS